MALNDVVTKHQRRAYNVPSILVVSSQAQLEADFLALYSLSV